MPIACLHTCAIVCHTKADYKCRNTCDFVQLPHSHATDTFTVQSFYRWKWPLANNNKKKLLYPFIWNKTKHL